MERGKVMVEGRNLSKEFNGNVVLKDVSIQCVQGEGLALAGEAEACPRPRGRFWQTERSVIFPAPKTGERLGSPLSIRS